MSFSSFLHERNFLPHSKEIYRNPLRTYKFKYKLNLHKSDVDYLKRINRLFQSTKTLIYICSIILVNTPNYFIKQLLVRRGIGDESKSNYSILGWLSLIQLSVAFLHQSFKLYQQHTTKTSRSPSHKAPSYQELTRQLAHLTLMSKSLCNYELSVVCHCYVVFVCDHRNLSCTHVHMCPKYRIYSN